jgi:hypothetical protein
MATATHTLPHQEHEHAHPHIDYAARSHPEFVAIDIGEECGALIIHTDPDMHAVEVEISASGHDAERQHKEVLERFINGEPAFTAVFDQVAEGSYTLWVNDAARAREVEITANEVRQLDWRS